MIDEEHRLLSKGHTKADIKKGKSDWLKAQKQRLDTVEHMAILQALNAEFPL